MKIHTALTRLAVLGCATMAANLGIAQDAPLPAPDYAPILNLSEPITVDGNADDWRIPAAVFLESPDGKAQMRFGSTYQRFYALVEVEDASPLKNGADRPEEMFKGGDTVAFYFKIDKNTQQRVAVCHRDGKNEVYVYREKAKKKKPYTFSSPVGDAKFDFVGPAEKAEVAFKKLGKKGYALEVSFAWRHTLDKWQHRPKDFTFDAQVVFGDAGGTQNIGAAWLFAREGPGLTVEDLPTEARLYPDTWGKIKYVDDIEKKANTKSLALVKPDGGVDLSVDLPRSGRLTVNIVDSKGWILRELVMAKKYSAGKHSIHWDGRDRYGEALPPGKYQWKAILFDGMKTEFMGSVGNSGRPPYRTPDGLGGMGGQHGDTKSLAFDDGGVYMANALQEGPPVMRKIDPVTGKAMWARSAGGFKSVLAVAADEGMSAFLNGYGSKGKHACDLVRIDPKTGKDVKMASGKSRVPLKEAQGQNKTSSLIIVGGKALVALPKDNKILTIDLKSGKQGSTISIPAPQGMARLNAKTFLVCSKDSVLRIDLASKKQTTVIKGLTSPRDVCVDKVGNMWVSELGASQRVKKFSPDGKKTLLTLGKKGGKSNQQIPYEPMAFRNITNLISGPKGYIWLAESDSLVKRYIKLDKQGKWLEDFYGPVAYNTFGPDLDDLTRVYYTIYKGRFVETKVNYDNYRKNPNDPKNGWKVVAIHDLALAADGKTKNKTMAEVAEAGYGHVIAFKGKNGKCYFFRMSKHNRARAPIGAGLWVEKGRRWVPCAFFTRDAKKHKSWSDQNGDGLIQANEEYTDAPAQGVAWIDRDLTLHGFSGKITPAAVSADGVPTYSKGAYKTHLNKGEESYLPTGWTFVSPVQNDSVYYILNYGPHRHLSFWDRATENRVVKMKNGKVQWVTGSHTPRHTFTSFTTASTILGELDGVVLTGNVEPCNYIAYTEDGFVLGDIMADENGKMVKNRPNTINIESFTGLYVKDPKTKKNVLFTVSSGDDRILEVKGPGKIDRLNGTATIKYPTPKENFGHAIPYSSWYGNTARGIGVDGEDTDWVPKVRSQSVRHKDMIVMDYKMRRDMGSLHLYGVILDHDMMPGDGIKLTFNKKAVGLQKTELTLALAREMDKRTKQEKWVLKPSMVDGKGKAIVGKIDTAVTERWQKLGYRVEIEIPLTMLPELSKPRKQVFRRRVPASKKIGNIEKTLPDLAGPFYFNLEVIGAVKPASLAKGNKLVKVDVPMP